MAGRRRRRPGELETSVLRVLWASENPMSARQVLDTFDQDPPALTTLLTVLDRLATKGQVTKTSGPEGLTFAPSASEAGHTADQMVAALVGTQDRSAALLRFAGTLDAQDVALLRRVLDTAPALHTAPGA